MQCPQGTESDDLSDFPGISADIPLPLENVLEGSLVQFPATLMTVEGNFHGNA